MKIMGFNEGNGYALFKNERQHNMHYAIMGNFKNGGLLSVSTVSQNLALKYKVQYCLEAFSFCYLILSTTYLYFKGCSKSHIKFPFRILGEYFLKGLLEQR